VVVVVFAPSAYSAIAVVVMGKGRKLDKFLQGHESAGPKSSTGRLDAPSNGREREGGSGGPVASNPSLLARTPAGGDTPNGGRGTREWSDDTGSTASKRSSKSGLSYSEREKIFSKRKKSQFEFLNNSGSHVSPRGVNLGPELGYLYNVPPPDAASVGFELGKTIVAVTPSAPEARASGDATGMDRNSGLSSDGSAKDRMQEAIGLPDTDWIRVNISPNSKGGQRAARHVTCNIVSDGARESDLSDPVLCCKHLQPWHDIDKEFQQYRHRDTCNTHSPLRGPQIPAKYAGALPEGEATWVWFCDHCGVASKAETCKTAMCVRQSERPVTARLPDPGHFLGELCAQCDKWAGGCLHAWKRTCAELRATKKGVVGASSAAPEREGFTGGVVQPTRTLSTKPDSELPLREGRAAPMAWKKPPMQPIERELPINTSGRPNFLECMPFVDVEATPVRRLQHRVFETTFAIGPSHCAAGSMLASEIPSSIPCTGVMTGEGRWTTPRFVLAMMASSERPIASVSQLRMQGTYTITISPQGIKCYGAYLGVRGSRVYWRGDARDYGRNAYGAEIIIESSHIPLESDQFVACRIGDTEFGHREGDKAKSMLAIYASFCTTLCTWQALPEDLQDHDGDSIVGANCLAATVHDLTLLGEHDQASYVLRCSTPRVEFLARRLLGCWDIKLPEKGVPCVIKMRTDSKGRHVAPWAQGDWCNGNSANTPKYVQEALDRLMFANKLWVTIQFTLDGVKECLRTSGMQSLMWSEVAQDELDRGAASRKKFFGAAFRIVFKAAAVPLASGGGVTAAGQFAKGRELNAWTDSLGNTRVEDLCLPRSDYHWERGATILIPARRGPLQVADEEVNMMTNSAAADELLDFIFMTFSECNLKLVPVSRDDLSRVANTRSYLTTERVFWMNRATPESLTGDPKRSSRRVHPSALPSMRATGSDLSGPVLTRKNVWLEKSDQLKVGVAEYAAKILEIPPPKEAFEMYEKLMKEAVKVNKFPVKQRPLPTTDCDLSRNDFNFLLPVSLESRGRDQVSSLALSVQYGEGHKTSDLCFAPPREPSQLSGYVLSKCRLGGWFTCVTYMPTESDEYRVTVVAAAAPKVTVLKTGMSIPGQPICKWVSVLPRLASFSGSIAPYGRDERPLGRGHDAEAPEGTVYCYQEEAYAELSQQVEVASAQYIAARTTSDALYEKKSQLSKLFDSVDANWREARKTSLASWRMTRAKGSGGPPRSMMDPPPIWVKTLQQLKESKSELEAAIEAQKAIGIELHKARNDAKGPSWASDINTLANICADICTNPGGHRSVIEFLGDNKWRGVSDPHALRYEREHPMQDEAMCLVKIALACASFPKHIAQLVFGISAMPLYSAGPSVVKSIGSEAHRALAAGDYWLGWSLGGLCEVQRLLLKATKLGDRTSRLPKARLSKPPEPLMGVTSDGAMVWLRSACEHVLDRLRAKCGVREGEMPGDRPEHLCARCNLANIEPCAAFRSMCSSCGHTAASVITKGGGTIAGSRLMGGGVNVVAGASGDLAANIENGTDTFLNQMILLGRALLSDELTPLAAWFSVKVPGGSRWQECPGFQLMMACIVLRNLFDLSRAHDIQVSMLRTFEGSQRMARTPKYSGLIAADGASASDGLTHKFIEMIVRLVRDKCGGFYVPNKFGNFAVDVTEKALHIGTKYEAVTFSAEEWSKRTQPKGPLLELTTPAIKTPSYILSLEVKNHEAWEEADWVLGWFMNFLESMSLERMLEIADCSFVCQLIKARVPNIVLARDPSGREIPDKSSLILCCETFLDASLLSPDEDGETIFSGFIGGGFEEFSARFLKLSRTFRTGQPCLCGMREDGKFSSLSDSPLYEILKGPPNRFDGCADWIVGTGSHLRRFLISAGQVPYISGGTGSGKTMTVFRSAGWYKSAIVLPTTLSAVVAGKYITSQDGKPTICIHYRAGAAADASSNKGALLFAPELMDRSPDAPGMLTDAWPSWTDRAVLINKVGELSSAEREEMEPFGGPVGEFAVDRRLSLRVERSILTPWQLANLSLDDRVIFIDEAQEMTTEKAGALGRRLTDGSRVVLVTATPPPQWFAPENPLSRALINIAIPGSKKKKVKILTDYRMDPPHTITPINGDGTALPLDYFEAGVTLHLYGSIAACIRGRDQYLKESGGASSPVKHMVLHGEMSKGVGSETEAVQLAAVKGRLHVHSTIGMAGSAITLGDVRVVRIDGSCKGKYKSWGTGADAPGSGLTEASLLQALGRGARMSDCALGYLPQGKKTDWHDSWGTCLSVSAYKYADDACQFMNATLYDQIMVLGNERQYSLPERIMCSHVLGARPDALPFLQQAYASASEWVGEDFSTWVASLRDEVCCTWLGQSYNPKLSFTEGLDPAHRTSAKTDSGADRLVRHSAISGDTKNSDPHFAAGVILSMGMGVSGYSLKTLQAGKYNGLEDKNPLRSWGVSGSLTSNQSSNVKHLVLPLFEKDPFTGARPISGLPMGGPRELARPELIVDGVKYVHRGQPLPDQACPTVAQREAVATSGKERIPNKRGIAMGSSLNGSAVNSAASLAGLAVSIAEICIFCSCYPEIYPWAAPYAAIAKPTLARGSSPPGSHNSGGDDTLPCGSELTLALICLLRQFGCGFEINWGKTVGGWAERGVHLPSDYLSGSFFENVPLPDGGLRHCAAFGGWAAMPAAKAMGPFLELYYRWENGRLVYRSPGPGVNIFDNFDSLFSGRPLGDSEQIDKYVVPIMTDLTGLDRSRWNFLSEVMGESAQPSPSRYSAFNTPKSETTVNIPLVSTQGGAVLTLPVVAGKRPGVTVGQRCLAALVRQTIHQLISCQQKARKAELAAAREALKLEESGVDRGVVDVDSESSSESDGDSDDSSSAGSVAEGPVPWQERPPPNTEKLITNELIGHGKVAQALWCGNSPRAEGILKSGELMGAYFPQLPIGVPTNILSWLVVPEERFALAIQKFAEVRRIKVNEALDVIKDMPPEAAALELSKVKYEEPTASSRCLCLASQITESTFMRVDLKSVNRRYVSALYALCEDQAAFREALYKAGMGEMGDDTVTVVKAPSEELVAELLMLPRNRGGYDASDESDLDLHS